MSHVEQKASVLPRAAGDGMTPHFGQAGRSDSLLM